MSATEYSKDRTIKFEYDPVESYRIFQLNKVGAEEAIDIDEASAFTPSDDNSVFVAKTGDDDTGDGTSSSPYLTIAKAIDECDPERAYVVVSDSGLYIEDFSDVDNAFFADIFAASGETPQYDLRDISVTLNDTNCIYVSSEGDDDTGDGTSSDPYATVDKAISELGGSLVYVCIQDSETYDVHYINPDRDGISGIFADYGMAPTLKFYGRDDDFCYSTAYYPYNGCALPDEKVTHSPTDIELDIPGTYDREDAILLDNGNIMMILDKDGIYGGHYFAIIDIDGQTVCEPVRLTTEDDVVYHPRRGYTVAAHKRDDGDVAIATVEYVAVAGYYIAYSVVYDEDGNLVCDKEVFSSEDGNETQVWSITSLSDNSFVVAYTIQVSTTATLYVEKFNSDGESQGTATVDSITGSDYSIRNCRLVTLGNDYYVLTAAYADDGVEVVSGCYFWIYDDTHTSHVGKTTFHATHFYESAYLLALPDNEWLVSYSDVGGNDYVKVYDVDGAHQHSPVTSSGHAVPYLTHNRVLLVGAAGFEYRAVDDLSLMYDDYFPYNKFGYHDKNILLSDGTMFALGMNGSNTNQMQYRRWFFEGKCAVGCYNSSSIIFEGLRFDFDDTLKVGLRYVFWYIDGLTLRYCTFDGCVSSVLDQNNPWSHVVWHEEAFEPYVIKNNIFIDNDHVFDTYIYPDSGDTVEVKWNLFVNNKGTAWENGSGAYDGSEEHEHNTYFGNRNSMDLGADEDDEDISVKNCIFHNNLLGMEAVDVTLYNSICNDVRDGFSLGTYSFGSNPLFRDEGDYDEEDMDLHLMSEAGGDPVNSPGLQLGDDGKNAGCYDDYIVGTGETWTEVEVQKPEVIPITYEPINPTKNQMADGSMISGKDGASIVYHLKWKGLINEDYEAILAIWKRGGIVRMYLQPETSPDDYILCRVDETNKLSDTVDYYALSEYARQNIDLYLMRRLDIE